MTEITPHAPEAQSPRAQTDIKSAAQYTVLSTEVVAIEGLPRGVAGCVEEITGIDASIATNRCVLPWAFLYPYELEAERLKAALSDVLKVFPIVSGRIVPKKANQDKYRRHFQLAHSNQGVPFVEAVANLKISDFDYPNLGRLQYRNTTLPAYYEVIDRKAVVQGKEPLMKVKLTRLLDGGCVLAVTASHVLVDGKSLVAFMNAWAEKYTRKSRAVAALPFHDRNVLEPSTLHASLLAVQREQNSRTAESVAPQNRKLHNIAATDTQEEEAEADIPISLDDRPRHSPNPSSDSGGSENKENEFVCWRNVPQPSVFGAMSKLWKLSRSVRQERLQFPKMIRELNTHVLHISSTQLRRLKAVATSYCIGDEYISSNDAVAALVWTLMCDIRGRPLPGHPGNSGKLGLAIDMRKNGLEHCVPETFFGNASWSVLVPGNKESVSEISGEVAEGALIADAFGLAARRIRSTLKQFRQDGNAPIALMKSLWDLPAAPLSSKIILISDVVLEHDAFLTSWQFPIWDIDFGEGGPKAFHGVVQPTPPFHGVAYPASPTETGVYLALTVPTSAADKLRSSSVLKGLVPSAHFLS